MELVVFSHKHCWPSPTSRSGYATSGGFPFQMRALSELFDRTRLVVPVSSAKDRSGEIPLEGHNLSVVSLTLPTGKGLWRKLGLFPWLVRNSITIVREIVGADAVQCGNERTWRGLARCRMMIARIQQ